MLAFSIDYYGVLFRATQSVGLFCTYDICINHILTEILESAVYRTDYEIITGKLLFTYVPYETVIEGINKIIEQGYFN